MIIDEITRPQEITQASSRLQQGGFRDLRDDPGHAPSTFGVVLARPDYPFVIKLFEQEDYAYRRYLKLITSVANPHFPKLRGKPIRVNNIYYAVRLELLEPIVDRESNDLRNFMDYYLEALKADIPDRIQSYADTLPPTAKQACDLIYQHCIKGQVSTVVDLHRYNAMKRPTGEIVIIDPIAYGRSTDTTPKHPTFEKFPVRPSPRSAGRTAAVPVQQFESVRPAPRGAGRSAAGLFEVTIQSPKNSKLYAKVEQYPNGVHVWFLKKSEGPKSPGGVLQHGVIDDKPFHMVIDHIYKVLSEDTRLGRTGRDYFNALTEYLRQEHNITNVTLMHRGKHPAIVFDFMGRRVSHFFPATGSDWRGIKNSLRDLRNNLLKIQQSTKMPSQIAGNH